MKRIITTLLAMAALAATVVWVFPLKHGVSVLPVVHAQNQNGSCSLASLSGPYATEGQGTFVGALPGFPVPPFPFGEVILDHLGGIPPLSISISGKQRQTGPDAGRNSSQRTLRVAFKRIGLPDTETKKRRTFCFSIT